VDAEESEGYLVAGLERLSEVARETGVLIGVEAADFFLPVDRFILLEDLALPGLGITVDTGHISWVVEGRATCAPFATPGRFVERFGSLVRHVHIHDYDGERDHLPIGRGSIDFAELLGALARIGYEGALSLEINSAIAGPEDVLESKAALERVLTEVDAGAP
jgi:sugar phosphate isomerase/epimerase